MGPKQIMCDCSKPNIFGKQYVGDALPGFCQLTFEKGCCGCCDLKIGTIIVAVLAIVFSCLGVGGGTWAAYLIYLVMAIGNLCFGVLAIIGSGCCTAPNWKFVHFFTMWQVFGLIWSIIGFIINIIVMATYTACAGQGTQYEVCVGIGAGAWIIMIGVSITYWVLCVFCILVTHIFAIHLHGGGGGDAPPAAAAGEVAAPPAGGEVPPATKTEEAPAAPAAEDATAKV